MARNKMLSRYILLGLSSTFLFAWEGGQTFAANELPADNTITIKQDIEYQTNDSIKANTITGEDKSAHLTITDGKNQNAVFIVNGGKTLSVTNLDSLTILNPNESSDGLEATGNATIDISNVNTVNIGTKDNPFNTNEKDGGQAIHGESGFVKLYNIGDLNIYTNAQGIMAQRSVGENPSDPSVDIQANGNIHIEAYDNAVMAGAINDKSGTAGLKMTAGGTIDISSQSGAAVESFDKSGSYESIGGPTFIDIEGTKGVSLKGAYGVYTTRASAGESKLNITSQEGDVYIEGSQYGLVVQSSGDNAYSDKTNINGTITGNNVTIANTNSDNYAVSINNSDVILATNRDGGTISLQSQSGKAANILNKNPNSLKGSLTIGDGKHETNFVSNGSLSIGKNATVTVADKTTTYVDVNELKGSSFIQNNGGTFKADDGAKLIVDNAAAGYKLFSNDMNVTNWTAANTSFDNAFLTLDPDGTVTTVSAEEAAKSLGAFAAQSIALAATTNNDTAITPLLKEGADAYNSAVNIGELGGAAHSTYTVSNLFTDAIAAHNAAQDKDIWAQYLHSKESVDGLGLAGTSANYDGQYNGVIVGGDIIRSQNKALGLAFSYTDGDISGSNGAAYTKNDAEYYGVALYGRLENPGYTLLGDISYLGGSHDISQYVAGQHVTAKPDTEAWSVGVKALRDYEVGSGTVTPYIGARYLRLTTDQYTSSLGIHYDSETQNLFLLPVGVDYSADIDHGSWKLRPYIGAGYIWTMGDRNGDQTISYGNAADTIAFDTADSGSFLAKAGITADWNTFSLGIGYAYQKSDNVKNNVWMANASFKF